MGNTAHFGRQNVVCCFFRSHQIIHGIVLLTHHPLTTHNTAMIGSTDAVYQTVGIERYSAGDRRADEDEVVVEEPLEIRLNDTPLAITMRTPGNDELLAVGFL